MIKYKNDLKKKIFFDFFMLLICFLNDLNMLFKVQYSEKSLYQS